MRCNDEEKFLDKRPVPWLSPAAAALRLWLEGQQRGGEEVSEAEVDFCCGLTFTICYTLLVAFGNIYAWVGLYQAIKEEK